MYIPKATEACLADTKMQAIDYELGFADSIYSIKDDADKDLCVQKISSIFIEYYPGYPDWVEGYANVLCKGELTDYYADYNSVSNISELIESWEYDSYDDLVNYELKDGIENRWRYDYSDVSSYFDIAYTYDSKYSICDGDYSDEFISHGDLIRHLLYFDVLETDDVENYFDKNIIECSKNYLSREWARNLTVDYPVSPFTTIESFTEGWSYQSHVGSITFHKSTEGFDGSGIDVSKKQNGSILLYKSEEYSPSEWVTLYDIDIVSNETIYFPKDSRCLFAGSDNPSGSGSCYIYLEKLDFNDSIDTSKVTNMYKMFVGGVGLNNIYVGNGWNINNVTNSEDMFWHCDNLLNYNSDYTDKTKAYVGTDGYLSRKDN